MPKGYGFLKKGNVYQSGQCRRLTREAGKTLYVVMRQKRQIGLRAPIFVLKEVHEKDRATKETRRENVARRDLATRQEFETALFEQFPSIPKPMADAILDRTLKKRSGRVGRTGTLSIEDKVRLAAVAQARHSTRYDELLKGGLSRNKAREEMKDDVRKILASWGAKKVPTALQAKKKPLSLPDTKAKGKPVLRPKSRARSETQGEETDSDYEQARSARSVPPISKMKRKKKGTAQATLNPPNRRSPRLQLGGNNDLEVLDHLFNDEDEPIIISSDDSDSDVQMDDADPLEGEDVNERATQSRRKVDEFVVYDSTDDSEDDFIL